jgi:hypothetical protein
MPTVEVDLDDLEALIYASAAIKNIESAIVTYKRDPFVQQMQGKFLPAQKRLETLVRNAKRSAARRDTVVHFDAPLTEAMAKFLVRLYAQRDQYGYSSIEFSYKLQVDDLAVRGMIEPGQYVYGGQWTGDDYPIVRIDPAYLMVRFTVRGEEEATRLLALTRTKVALPPVEL